MSSLIATIKFLFYSVCGVKKPIKPMRQQLLLPNNELLDTYIYTPKKMPKGTILFFHGMNKFGALDERIVNVAQVLARCGFRVITPTYPRVTNLLINPDVADDFELSIEAIVANQAWCPNGRLSIFNASFAGGLALRTISLPNIRDFIDVYCVIGGWISGRDSIEFTLSNGTKDRYAKLIYVRKVLQLSEDYDPIIDKGLEIAIDDEFEQEQANRLPKYLKNLDAKAAQRIENIVQNIDDTREYLSRYPKAVDKVVDHLEGKGELRDIRCPIVILHSATDDIFSPTASKDLHRFCQTHGIPSRLMVTDLLDHADFSAAIKHLPDIIRLMKLFAYFFRHVESGNQPKNREAPLANCANSSKIKKSITPNSGS